MDIKSSSAGGCIAASVVAFAFVCVMALAMCYKKVPGNMVGVRTLAQGGIENKDYPPGYVLCIPGLHSVRLWDPTWTDVYRRMQVRGSDQYVTTVDVSVIFRIKPQMCHVVTLQYPTYAAIEQRANQIVSLYSNEILTKMNTEDFYNSVKREAQTKAMEDRMKKDFDDLGLELKSVLLRNIDYDKTFEEQLLKKQIAGQTKSFEESRTKQATGEMATELIEKGAAAEVESIKERTVQEIKNTTASTEQRASKITQDAEQEAAKITALAQATKRKNMAEAERLRAEATAYGTALLSKVYAKPGASYYFAQRALQGMKLGTIEVNSTNYNPLDSEKLLKGLGLDLNAPRH